MAKVYFALAFAWLAAAVLSFWAVDKIWVVGDVICSIVLSSTGVILAAIKESKNGVE